MAPMFVKDALTLLEYAYKITFSLDILCFSLNLVKNPVNWESMCLMYCWKMKQSLKITQKVYNVT